jgi:cell division protein FtsB
VRREFTQREKVLLLILTAVLLLTGYLKLFSAPLENQLLAAQEQTADAQSEMQIEQTKLTQLQRMEKELKKLKDHGAAASEIPDYDNINNVMVQLDAILRTAADYDLTFSNVEFGDTLVSRPIQMTFSAKNYAAAKTILDGLYHCRYRCALSDLTVSASQGADVTAGPVEVSLTVTFYERSPANAAAQSGSQETAGG